MRTMAVVDALYMLNFSIHHIGFEIDNRGTVASLYQLFDENLAVDITISPYGLASHLSVFALSSSRSTGFPSKLTM